MRFTTAMREKVPYCQVRYLFRLVNNYKLFLITNNTCTATISSQFSFGYFTDYLLLFKLRHCASPLTEAFMQLSRYLRGRSEPAWQPLRREPAAEDFRRY